jgi:hypothetical protein
VYLFNPPFLAPVIPIPPKVPLELANPMIAPLVDPDLVTKIPGYDECTTCNLVEGLEVPIPK